jgi:hypothetical protein
MDRADQNAENHLCNHRLSIIIVFLISKQTHRSFTFPDHGFMVPLPDAGIRSDSFLYALPILFDYLW